MEEWKQRLTDEIQHEVQSNSVLQGQSLSQLHSLTLQKINWPLRIQIN
jgi:hypothetical protein